ncbi:MAG: hypothetical protein ACK5AZ_08760 [Bryobacteraceae bacterium]
MLPVRADKLDLVVVGVFGGWVRLYVRRPAPSTPAAGPADCTGCHPVARQVKERRSSFVHFEHVHSLVLERNSQ